MRDFRALSTEAVLSELKTPKDTLITCHVKPDGDCLGSAFALKEILRTLGSRAWVVCAEECPSRLSFLLDGEQTSVLPEAIPTDFAEARVIAVDTASPGQAGALFLRYEDRFTLSIDHHGRGTPFADHYILPNASATGEVLFGFVRMLVDEGTLDAVTERIAFCLYTAISSDTGCFRYSNAAPETHRVAAELLSAGIDSAEINRRLFSSVPYLQMATEQEGFRRLRLFEGGRVAAITFPLEAKLALGIKDEHTETLVDVARVIEGVDVAFVLKQPSDEPIFRLSMRSAIDFDVSLICAVFGGGGHARAAGATITVAKSIEEALDLVLAEIHRRLSTEAL